MKRILFLAAAALLIYSCSDGQNKDLSKKAAAEIMETEKAFSALSEKEGMKKAFLHFAADDVVKLTNGQHPSVGKDELAKSLEGAGDTSSVLKWYPLKADAASSGELGYTYGNWEYTGKDSAGAVIKHYGNYFTIWKKDKEGNWKFTLDGGNSTPPPSGEGG